MTPVTTPLRSARSRSGAAALLALLGTLIVLAAIAWVPTSHAQAAATAQEQGVRWRDLKPAQQNVLRPLEREWSGIGAAHKQKWIELSGNFEKRSPAERQRIQERMTEWARLSPQERSQARLHFQEANQLTPQDRKARWDAYQALPPEKKQQLADRAAPSAPAGAKPPAPPRADAAQAKSNIVPNPALAAPPRVIAPSVVQAQPGATTTLITKRPTPPTHQQTGLPKIAATPEFVNKATLLPRRGPQGAATRSAAGPASEPRATQ
jgi:Protein of unknown function (DUF3106)